MWSPIPRANGEPAIADLLSDPIGQALMRADGVAVSDIVALVARLNAMRAERDRRASE